MLRFVVCVSAKRTQVIDDESDYFSTSSRWLNKKERSALEKRETELREKKHASRLDRKVTLDFAGRQVLKASVIWWYFGNASIAGGSLLKLSAGSEIRNGCTCTQSCF